MEVDLRASGFAIDITTVFSPHLDSNRLDTISMVFQVLSFKEIVLRWLIQLLSRVVCRVNIGDLRSENGESAYQVFTVEPQVGIHSLLAHLSPVWKELCVEKTLTKEIFKSSLFERLRKAVNNAHFIVASVNESKSSSSTSHLLEEQQDRLSDSMDDLFYQTAKDSSLFSLA